MKFLSKMRTFLEQLATGLALGGLLSLNIMLVPPVYIDSLDKYRVSQAHTIFNNLKLALGGEFSDISLHVVDIPVENAFYYYHTGTVVITKKMLKALNHDDDQIANLLGHELAHGYLLHNLILSIDGEVPQRLLEKTADLFGQSLALRAGYDACKANIYWEESRNRKGDNVLYLEHPSDSEREFYLRCK